MSRPVGRLRYAAIGALILVVDQLTKYAVVSTFRVGESTSVVDGVLRITHIRNTGAAFGLLRGWSGVLALAAVVGVVIFAGVIVRHPPPVIGVGAALICGGALGNLVDRAFRPWPFAGSVVDFVDLRYWPAFNVADAAITTGAVLLVLAGVFERDADDASETAADTGGDGAAARRGG